MKKFLAVVLVVCMVCTLAACGVGKQAGSAANNGKDVELTFWAHTESWNNSYQAIAEEFTKKNPHIKIKFEFFPYDEYESKLQTSLIAKEKGGADIYELWGGWGIDFASTGALAAIPADMASGIMNDSYPSTYKSLEYNGKLYGIPMEFNIECGGMFVNLKLLKENGMTIPTTWDELLADAKKATRKNGDEFAVKGFDFVNWDGVTYLFLTMILSSGGQYLNEDGTINFTSDQAKDAFSKLASYVNEDKVTDLVGLTGGGDLEGYQQLFADKALFVPRGPWPIIEGKETFGLEYDKDFTYAKLPWYGTKIAFPAETGWALAVNGSSAKQEAAFEFLKYFYSDDVLMKHNIYCSMIPPKKTVAHNPELVKEMPFAETLVGILDQSQYIGRFNTDTVKQAVNNAFVEYCTGKYASVDDALEKLQSTINEKIAHAQPQS